MNKPVLLLLVAVLVLLPMPVAAHEATPFTASGSICLVGPPTIEKVKLTPTGARITTTGEVLGGTVTSSTWEALLGAPFAVTVEEEKSFFNFVTLTFSGRLEASFSIGESLSGELKGTVWGAFSDPATLPDSIYASSALAQWQMESNGTEAKGTTSATFGFAVECASSFGGTIDFSGIFKEND